jgi:hypothetical protein
VPKFSIQVGAEDSDQLGWDRHDPHRVGGSSLERATFASLAVVGPLELGQMDSRQVPSSQLGGHLPLSDTPSHRNFAGGSRLNSKIAGEERYGMKIERVRAKLTDAGLDEATIDKMVQELIDERDKLLGGSDASPLPPVA